MNERIGGGGGGGFMPVCCPGVSRGTVMKCGWFEGCCSDCVQIGWGSRFSDVRGEMGMG